MFLFCRSRVPDNINQQVGEAQPQRCDFYSVFERDDIGFDVDDEPLHIGLFLKPVSAILPPPINLKGENQTNNQDKYFYGDREPVVVANELSKTL